MDPFRRYRESRRSSSWWWSYREFPPRRDRALHPSARRETQNISGPGFPACEPCESPRCRHPPPPYERENQHRSRGWPPRERESIPLQAAGTPGVGTCRWNRSPTHGCSSLSGWTPDRVRQCRASPRDGPYPVSASCNDGPARTESAHLGRLFSLQIFSSDLLLQLLSGRAIPVK